MKHIKLYESFLGFGRVYEAESSETKDISGNRNMVVIVAIVNSLWKTKLLNRINTEISKGIKNPITFTFLDDFTIEGTLNLKATNYKVEKIFKIDNENPDSEFSTYSVKGYANLDLKYTIKELEDEPIEISFTTYFNQKLELDFVEVVKIYPPALSISTNPENGNIEGSGYIYLNNSQLMFCPSLDKEQKPKNPKKIATLQLQDKVELAFDSSKKGAPFVHKLSEEEKKELNI